MKITGMRAFWLVAIGQFISLTGSAMTQFALGIWVFQQTGQATPLAGIAVANALPIFLSPVIGALVDRWNRKLTMMISDLGAGIVTIMLFFLFSTGNLQIWHLMLGAFISSLCGMFQWPAYSAAISVMVSKEQYTRANALQGLAESASGILAPSLAAALLVGVVIGGQQIIPALGVAGIMMLDIVTFIAAIGALLIITVPQPERSATGAKAQSSFWSEMSFGFRYIFTRPGLLGLQLVFMFGNLFAGIGGTLLVPMILSRSDNNEQILGLVTSMFGIGGIVGGLLLSLWGGPKRRVNGVLMGHILSSLGGTLLFGLGRIAPIWMFAAFFTSFVIPALNGSNQSIWQAKVPPDVQGKVFAIRRMIAWGANPLAALLAGFLADQVFEPAMREGGTLVPLFSGLVGSGPGAGMALIFILVGICGALVGAAGYLVPAIRNVEDDLPDHGAVGAA
jgi:MFS transporter, DHA3 family, macrolide efflux protein